MGKKPPPASSIHVLGIRHHGPGSARLLLRALDRINPDVVLIEGPSDAQSVLHFAARDDFKPPLAILVFNPEQPQLAMSYPFAEFSPEWNALRWAARHSIEARFIDLPFALKDPRIKSDKASCKESETQPCPSPAGSPDSTSPDDVSPDALSPDASSTDDPSHSAVDVLEELAKAAGFSDGEAWWGRLIEEHRAEEDPLPLFEAILEAMREARTDERANSVSADNPAREAHMRQQIRLAIKNGFSKVVVICGAFHAPSLSAKALEAHAAKDDEALLKQLTKQKTSASWVPWTSSHLAARSGYGAGIVSPGWYQHLWEHSGATNGHERHTPSTIATRWLSKLASLLRANQIDASPAQVIDAVRLAETLAHLRSREHADLEDLTQATLATLLHGNSVPLQLIHNKLIVGDLIGELPDDAPLLPLQQDVQATQKRLGLKPASFTEELDLDLRKDRDLARSHFLHRLVILGINWGKVSTGSRRNLGTFRETWKLEWSPELAIDIVAAAQFGNTVESAATACLDAKARSAADIDSLARLLGHALYANIPSSIPAIITALDDRSAASADFLSLVGALSQLVAVHRYGDVRSTASDLLEPVIRKIIARICVGLLPACTSLDDEAAKHMGAALTSANTSMQTLNEALLITDWHARLKLLADAQVHGFVAGRSVRILTDVEALPIEATTQRMSLALSPGSQPAQAAAWLEGFLDSSGMILIHDQRLLNAVDNWLTSLSDDAFTQTLPLARRSFGAFSAPERREIGEQLRKRGQTAAASFESIDFDSERAALMIPILDLFLGGSHRHDTA